MWQFGINKGLLLVRCHSIFLNLLMSHFSFETTANVTFLHVLIHCQLEHNIKIKIAVPTRHLTIYSLPRLHIFFEKMQELCLSIHWQRVIQAHTGQTPKIQLHSPQVTGSRAAGPDTPAVAHDLRRFQRRQAVSMITEEVPLLATVGPEWPGN